jgi:LysR family hydrogen peroxide-inducible transcriptional activator
MAHPTLKQLKYLIAVSDHLHFGHAAQACFVSQSTLSMGIAELENTLGVSLIERTNKSVRLTQMGRKINHKARVILAETNDLVFMAQSAQKPFQTEMHMGIIPTIAPFILPSLLEDIRNLHPNFTLYVREDLSGHLIEQLYAGNLDVLLLALPYPAEDTETRHLFDDELLLACCKDNTILQKSTLSTSDLNQQEFVLLEDGHCLRDHSMEACKIHSESIFIRYQATSLNTVIQMVANNIGITILPKMAVDAQFLNHDNVITKSFDDDNVSRSIGLMWRKSSPRVAEFEVLCNLIQQRHSA